MELIFKIFLRLGLGLILASYIHCQSLRGANLMVSISLDTPYIRFREGPRANITGNDRFEGYIVDLIEEASKILGFKYVLTLNEAGYGFADRYGKGQGVLGDVVNGRAHIAAGPIVITSAREAVVDFTYPFMQAGTGILYKKSAPDAPSIFDNYGLFQPFRDYTTDAFLLIIIILGIALLLLRRKNKSLLFRTLLGVWLLFFFVFASLFIAQLSAFYVKYENVSKSYKPFVNSDQLFLQTRIKYGAVQGGSTQAMFRNSENNSFYGKIWKQMESADPSPFVRNNEEGIERVKTGDYAFLTESPFIEYVVERDCDLYQVGPLLNSKSFALAVQQGSSIRDALNLAILELEERGILFVLKNRWWTEKNGGGSCDVVN